MLIPCIDLQDGRAVQLVHGKTRELEVADVMGLLVEFQHYAWLHVIDLDAAMEKGCNDDLTRQLCQAATTRYGMKVRVGGGIRTASRAEQARQWNSTQVIIGSAAFKGGTVNLPFLSQLRDTIGKDNVLIALDTANGRILVRGWREKLELQPKDVIASLEPFCAGFLCTDVDREGTMSGVNLEWFTRLRQLTSHSIVAAGGIKTRDEIEALEKLGMDAAVGMALYKKQLK